MANKSLFRSFLGRLAPKTDALNFEGAPAYALSPRHALAQYAATGCLSQTFYASAEEQLARVLELSSAVEPELLARLALHARQRGHMKDLPALLCALLAVRDGALLARVFDHVIDSGKMVRSFVQIIRSGTVGRKSLGSLPKRLVERWLEARDNSELLAASVGNDPSLADIIKMVHPRPTSPERSALYRYFLGREVATEALPEILRAFVAFRANPVGPPPAVPFQMLTSLVLSSEAWAEIARNGSWQMVRMNLNTLARHGAFRVPGVAEHVAQKLRDRRAICGSRVFPYQILVAFRTAGADVPQEVKEALQDALEIAIENVPALAGKIHVCPDVSGSMKSPITGARAGSSTAVRCVDVAALVAAALVRRNPTAEIHPFDTMVVPLTINPRDSIATNAARLASVGGGGTSTSAPLARLNEHGAAGDIVVIISDNQSWVDARTQQGTETMVQWLRFKDRNPGARLVCLDLQPNATTQAAESVDVLNIGGFSDTVFPVIAEFAAGRLGRDHWLGLVEATPLPDPQKN